MGVDIHVYVYKYNEDDNKFHRLKLYSTDSNTGELKEIYIFNGRNSEMFSALQNNEEDNYGFIPCRHIRINSLADAEQKELRNYMNASGYYGFSEISFYALRQYIREHPQVKDYDEYWEEDENGKSIPVYCTNPIKMLVDEIGYFIEFTSRYGVWSEAEYDDYKVIYFFDC